MNFSKQLTRRECILLALLGILLLFAAYFFAVHRPVTESLERIQQENESISLELTVLEAKQRRMAQMQKELDAILQQPHPAQIPHYDNLEQIMGFLNTLLSPASDYALSFESLARTEESQLLRRTMSLTFTCDSYQLARDMVLQLEACPYRCQLDDLSISPAVSQNAHSSTSLPLTAGAVTVSLRVTFFESNG